MRWWLGILSFQCLTGIAFSFTRNLCALEEKDPAEALDEGLILDKDGKDFQTEVIITDWMTQKLSIFKEAHKFDIKRTLMYRQSASEEILFTDVRGKRVVYNLTDSSCFAFVDTKIFPISEDIVHFLGANVADLVDLTKLVVAKSQTAKGFRTKESVVENGIEGVEWHSCSNTTSPVGIQLRVLFAGKGSIAPVKGKTNPLPLSIQFTQFKNMSDPNSDAVFNVSFTFSSFNEPALQNSLFQIPDGVICSGLDEAKPDYSHSLPEEFTASIAYNNPKEKPFNTHMLYASLYVVASTQNSTGFKSLLNLESLPPNCTTVIHDFYLGYEACFSSVDECLGLKAFEAKAFDVRNVDYGIAAHYSILIPNDTQKWSQYDDKFTKDGTLTIYRGTRETNNEVIEVRLLNASIYEVIRYQRDNNRWNPTALIRPTVLTSTPNVDYQMTDLMHKCYPPKVGATFAITFKEDFASFKQTKLLAKALKSKIFSKFSISEPRIRISFIPSVENKLMAVLSFADASTAPRAPVVVKFNETATDEVIKNMNTSITGDDFPVDITANGRIYTWTVPKNSFTSYPPPASEPKPGFQGYTGGAMFVTAVFMLMFGVGLGAGGLFFVTRRQRISTFAYQVFE